MAETPDESLLIRTLRLRISDANAGCLEQTGFLASSGASHGSERTTPSCARPSGAMRNRGRPRLVVGAGHMSTAANGQAQRPGPQRDGANPPRRRPVERGRGGDDATAPHPPGDGRTPRGDGSHQRVQVHYRTMASVALGCPRPAPENEPIPPPLHERKKREPPPFDPPQPPPFTALRAPRQIRARQGGISLSDGGSSGTRGRIPPGTQPRTPRR